VVFNFAAEGEPSTMVVENVALDMGFNGRRVDTPIGALWIQDAGSASVDGSTWHKFRISSADTAIVGASVMAATMLAQCHSGPWTATNSCLARFPKPSRSASSICNTGKWPCR
jgi:hypothetical protein